LRTAAGSCESIQLDGITTTEDGIRCDLYSRDETPEDVLAAHGAEIDGIVAGDGTVTITVSIADRSVVSALTEALTEAFDDVTVTTLWNGSTEESAERTNILAPLTEKQQTALETAFRAGYFEWPRTSTGEEISERLGIAPATFGQHLRTAERKVFEALFES